MAIGDLPTDQKDKVLQQQRSDDSLPTYYSANLRTSIKISREFEAFLILASSSLKNSSLQWVQKAVTLNKKDQQRDSLLALALTSEANNAALKLTECNTQLQNYNDFRSKFTVPAALSTAPEVQLFLGDLQTVIGDLIVTYDRAFFDQTITKVMQNNSAPNAVSDQQIQELQSWSSVISAYLG